MEKNNKTRLKQILSQQILTARICVLVLTKKDNKRRVLSEAINNFGFENDT